MAGTGEVEYNIILEDDRLNKKARPWVLAVLFLLIMTAGLLLGEYKTVLAKAVTVCLNCIGIG